MAEPEISFVCNIGPRKDLSPNIPMQSNWRAIRIYHSWITGTYRGSPDSHQTYTDILTLANSEIVVVLPKFLYYRKMYMEKLAKEFADIRVPESMIPDIVDRVFEEVELSENPDWPIECDMTFKFLYPELRDVASLLESSEKVGIDSLEYVDRQQLCVICRESLDHSEGVEEEIDFVQLIRLPCSHLYHKRCIFQCLEMIDFCPVCRYSLSDAEHSFADVEHSFTDVERSLPVAEHSFADVEYSFANVEQSLPVVEQVAKPSEPLWRQQRLPMLLIASAGGILSVVLVFRLLKQNQV
ncbi:PREDICTED: uncharacterized protein LOC101302072 isoform 2 [Fragaria vesca subsp. vesca]|nr:PREDICTED: uncharacterized protein LOC101302072 isoform X2 [Fragaria vesca subsp. vesca]